ncbi:MAG: shikimate dehydrogenase, partial [Bacteroidia bacterium]|nr:shikimate dehydrogenase [Bacteroidia bacterium]MDW8236433.1 shikimate dehydrogenase [Bacteroidia bacterium]
MRLGLLAGESIRSFSPIFFRRIHGLFYQQYTPQSENWKQELSGLRWTGFNVTTPYKEAIFPYLDEVSPEVQVIQAANTVVVLPDGKWIGYNTDFRAALEILEEMRRTSPAWESIVLLGTGGAAR